MTDKHLLELLQNNPQQGLEEVVKRYSAYVMKITNTKLHDVCTKEDIEEAVSDIFLIVFRNGQKCNFNIHSLRAYVSADVANTYDIVYSVSPAIAQTMKPLNATCESNGIEMNVISASIVENEIYAYVSITDKQGDRIDSTVDLYDSYSIKTPFRFDSMGGAVSLTDTMRKQRRHISLFRFRQWTEKA